MSSQDAKILVSEVEDGIAVITLNRPAKRNALDAEAREGLMSALEQTMHRAKVVVVVGAGGTFSSGMDLSQITEGSQDDEDQLNKSWVDVLDGIRRHPAIFIAAARGYALGGGSTLINVCDLAVVARDTQIGMPELGFGFYPGLAGPAAQLRLGHKRAAWMILTAQRINGETAVDWGMANQAVDDAEVEAEAMRLARTVAQFDATALEWTKKALWHVPTQVNEWRTALEYGSYVNAQIHARTDSHRQALKDFADGQPNPGQGRSR
ncbi:enoyl-CoA hydratase/isomerase family protein [Nocardioides sp.]|uniref:enoyl-CoA hydratase/isomerase family protein n=1 Tax=Nocardioides sp. TaxID=35761 RepID=UPI003D0EAD1F